jgi:hypothetical protein
MKTVKPVLRMYKKGNKNDQHWKSFDVDGLPVWVGFAWFGRLRFRNKKNGKIIETEAGGVYCGNGKNMEFKFGNWPDGENLRDYEITHYITRSDKISK